VCAFPLRAGGKICSGCSVTGATQRERGGTGTGKRVELHTQGFFLIPAEDDVVKTGIYGRQEVVVSAGRYSAFER